MVTRRESAVRPGTEAVTAWLREQTRRDATVYMTAATGMGIACFVASLIQLLCLFVLYGLFLCGMNLSKWIPFILAVATFVGLWIWHLRFDRPVEEEVLVDAGDRGRLKLTITPLTGTSWLLFLDRPAENMNPVVRFFVNIVLLAPRLGSLSKKMYLLSKQCRERDIPLIAAGLDRLMQGGRFEIGGLIEEFPEAPPQHFLDQLTGIEGVVFLGSGEPSLTLTPSFMDEFDTWRRDNRRNVNRADYD